MKKIIALLCSAALFTGCGNTVKRASYTTESNSDLTDTSITEPTEKNTMTNEEAYVFWIAERGFESLRNGNIDNIADYTDVDIFYYLAFGEVPDRESLIEELTENSELSSLEAYCQNLKPVGVKKANEALPELISFLCSDYFSETADNVAGTFIIDGAYLVELEDEPDAKLYVLRINDEWTADIVIGPYMQMEEMYGTLSSEISS